MELGGIAGFTGDRVNDRRAAASRGQQADRHC